VSRGAGTAWAGAAPLLRRPVGSYARPMRAPRPTDSPAPPPASASTPSPAGLADRLRARTQALHVQAERSGVIRELLRGRGSVASYALLLRNLLPAYATMEEALERHRTHPGIGLLAEPAVYRAARLAADLETIAGAGWRDALPLLPAGLRYAERVADAGADEGGVLLGHVYVRYLGDLNGGRILARRLGETLGLGAGALSFHAYPDVADLDAFKQTYRRRLDQAAPHVDVARVTDEAEAAFRLNTALSEAVAAETGDAPGA